MTIQDVREVAQGRLVNQFHDNDWNVHNCSTPYREDSDLCSIEIVGRYKTSAVFHRSKMTKESLAKFISEVQVSMFKYNPDLEAAA